MQLKTRGERTLRKLLPYLSVSCHYTIVLLYSYQLSQSKTTVTVLVSYLSIVLVGLSMEQTSSTFPLLEPAAILYVISRKVFSSANLVYQSRQTQSRNKTIIEFDSGFKNDLAGIILNPKVFDVSLLLASQLFSNQLTDRCDLTEQQVRPNDYVRTYHKRLHF